MEPTQRHRALVLGGAGATEGPVCREGGGSGGLVMPPRETPQDPVCKVG